MINIIKAIVVATVALFFSLIAFNNLTDFETNGQMIAHILKLESVHNETIAWRAIENTSIHLWVYWMFIIAEIITAVFCWMGCIRLLSGHTQTATLGLLFGFLIYMVGFVVIGSEWFNLWQSDLSNGQIKGLLYSILLLGCMLFVEAPKKS